jgi:hypothetical protein
LLMSKQNPIRRLAASKIRDFSDRLLAGRKQGKSPVSDPLLWKKDL